MATKLKNLHVTKVDFVDEGANPRANIKLAKSKDGETGEEPEETHAQEDTPAETQMEPETEPSEGLFKRFLKWWRGNNSFVQKDAESFTDVINEASIDAIRREIWETTDALARSFNSILSDEDADSNTAQTAMAQSLAQFNTAVAGYIPSWAGAKTVGIEKSAEQHTEADLRMDMIAYENLGKIIEKSREKKGELDDMIKIDKSKMTPEERAQYEELVKKYSVDDGVTKEAEGTAPEADQKAPETVETQKSATAQTAPAAQNDGEEVLKGVVADLKKQISGLQDQLLTQQLSDVAKRYEPLGKKPEEMLSILKKAKAANMYDEVIAAYDSALEAQKSSGMFTEIGKSTEGTADHSDAIAKARSAAEELRKSNPNMTSAQALDQVLLGDAELRKEFDQ